jgi:head-tail adaptor
MGIESRYIHTLVIERATAGAPDDYGQPVQAWATLATVAGLVLPKSAREVALTSQGGAVVADHTIFMAPRDVTEADRVKLSPDDGRIFELTGVRNFIEHHLECDAKVVR